LFVIDTDIDASYIKTNSLPSADNALLTVSLSSTACSTRGLKRFTYLDLLALSLQDCLPAS